MIEIESRELADIPVLHAYPVGQKDTPLPCAIFYHGFTSSSLVYSYFAVALAQAGLRGSCRMRPITVVVLVATQRGG